MPKLSIVYSSRRNKHFDDVAKHNQGILGGEKINELDIKKFLGVDGREKNTGLDFTSSVGCLSDTVPFCRLDITEGRESKVRGVNTKMLVEFIGRMEKALGAEIMPVYPEVFFAGHVEQQQSPL